MFWGVEGFKYCGGEPRNQHQINNRKLKLVLSEGDWSFLSLLLVHFPCHFSSCQDRPPIFHQNCVQMRNPLNFLVCQPSERRCCLLPNLYAMSVFRLQNLEIVSFDCALKDCIIVLLFVPISTSLSMCERALEYLHMSVSNFNKLHLINPKAMRVIEWAR